MQWSKLKKRFESRLAPCFHGRLQIHVTEYRTGIDVGRGWITFDGKDVCSAQIPSFYDDQAFYEANTLDFGVAVGAYFEMSADEALTSPHPIVQALAFLDKKVGKRRLSRFEGAELHPFPHATYRLRYELEELQTTRRALSAAEEAADIEAIVRCLDNLGRCLVRSPVLGEMPAPERLSEAEALAKRSIEIHRDREIASVPTSALQTLARVYDLRTNWEEAALWLDKQIASILKARGPLHILPQLYQKLGHYHELTGREEEADAYYEQAINLMPTKQGITSGPLPNPNWLIVEFHTTIAALDARSNRDRMERLYKLVLESREGNLDGWAKASLATDYAVFLAEEGRSEEATTQAARARAALEKDKDSPERRARLVQKLLDHGL